MRLYLPATAAISIAVGACADLTTQTDGRVSEPASFIEGDSAQLASPEPRLLVCQTAETRAARATIGPEGGTISTRGSAITMPPGAVPTPTEFEFVVPASPYMELEIHAVGMDSYIFDKPATITINYARCPGDAVPPDAKLKGVHIDDVSKQVLEVLGGVPDRVGQKISFSTGHLSGYAVAF